MTTDITELAQSLKEAANKAGADGWQAKKISGDFYVIRKGSYKRECGYLTYQPIAEIDHKPTRDYVAIASPANILALVETLEKAQQPIVPVSVPDEYVAPVPTPTNLGYEAGWNACRAVMLAAAPHDTPALNSLQGVDSVTGGWIPVSERMPEVGDIVLTAMGGAVNVGEMECSAANCLFFTSVISGRELPATHWMPLPAGPKEDINALIPLVSRNEQEGK
ncbi:DUF551 domain-containing protein [Klebsiella pneumoniae]